MSLRIEAVKNVLNHRPADILPRGELFIARDFLDRYFHQDEGRYTKQIERAAQSFNLSLIGVPLDTEWSESLLFEGRYLDLEQYFVVGCMNGPISRLIGKHGFFDAMRSLRNDASLFSNIVQGLVRDVKARAELARENGFGGVAITDDIAGNQGLFFSYDYFRETVWPVYKEVCAIIQGNGLLAFFHSDGDTEKMIEPLIEAGYDCLHPVDTLAGLNLYELKEKFGKRVSFMGHIDIITWSDERIRTEITRAESEFKQGGLILGSTCGLSMETANNRFGTLYHF